MYLFTSAAAGTAIFARQGAVAAFAAAIPAWRGAFAFAAAAAAAAFASAPTVPAAIAAIAAIAAAVVAALTVPASSSPCGLFLR